MIDGILAKASDIGFNSLRVAHAQMNCCGAIIKYRLDDVATEATLDHDLGCPHCGGEGFFYGGVNRDGSRQMDFEPQSHSFIDDIDDDDFDSKHEEAKEYAMEEAQMENQCQECGSHMDFSMGWDDEDQMEYPKYRDALEAGYEAAGGGSYECPSCGQYDTVRDVMENQHDPRGALRWVQDQYYAPNDGGGGDEAIAVARMPYAYDEAERRSKYGVVDPDNMPNFMRGRPSRGQLKLRGKLKNMGISPRDAGYGYSLNRLAESKGLPPAKYDPMKDKRRVEY